MDRNVVVLALLLVAGTGCGKPGEISIDVKDSSGKTAHVTAGAMGTVSLPANFPKDVPTPKDSTVATSVAQGKDLMVSFQVKGTVPETLAFYQAGLKAAGWTLDPPTDVNGTTAILEGEKGPRKCAVMIMSGNGQTVVQVHASVE
jgi:hypothetical protein